MGMMDGGPKKEQALTAHLGLKIGDKVEISEPGLTQVPLQVINIRTVTGRDKGIPFKLMEYSLLGTNLLDESNPYADEQGDINLILRVLPRVGGGDPEALLYWVADEFPHDRKFMEMVASQRKDVTLPNGDDKSLTGCSRVDDEPDGYRAEAEVIAGVDRHPPRKIEYWDFQRTDSFQGVTYQQFPLVEVDMESGTITIKNGFETDPATVFRI